MVNEVEIRNVTKFYGGHRAVDNVSLSIKRGSFVSLLGPSGAGKSTILRMIGGFEYPDSGFVYISGKDVTSFPPYRRDVNTVFQSYALFPHMTVADNVAYGLRQIRVPGNERRSRVRDALSSVEMLSFADRRPSQLSGGQQQRVALARAIVNRPSVLLLDEPLAALDRRLRHQMQVELKLLQGKLGLTFVFVTHDQEEALAMSDSVVVTRNGCLEQVGTPTELYDRPCSAFVAGFIGSQNFLAGSLLSRTTMRSSGGEVLEAGRSVGNAEERSPVVGAVRPEDVLVSCSEPVMSINRVPAEVSAAVMLGDTVELVTNLTDGTTMTAKVRRATGAVPNVGAKIWLHWDPKSFTIFADELAAEQLRGC